MKLLIFCILVLCSVSNVGAVTKPCGKIPETLAEVTHEEYDGVRVYSILFPIKYRETRLTGASIQYGSPGKILVKIPLENHSDENKIVRVISSSGHEQFSIVATYLTGKCIEVNSTNISPWVKKTNDN